MHESEAGVWKSLFIHLLRILDLLGDGRLNELDHRCVHTQSHFTSGSFLSHERVDSDLSLHLVPAQFERYIIIDPILRSSLHTITKTCFRYLRLAFFTSLIYSYFLGCNTRV
jgi:hypothetical protein